MDNNQQELKRFLEEQLLWCKEQESIMENLDSKLYEMKRIAEYALEHELSSKQVEVLNYQLNELKNEVFSLEEQLRSINN
ncbi:hypothetical protein LCM00_13240 [Bacillus infantis]|uniref:hypothetical protein n=1 Tax=Bacillus infantis TaxID=324767 RepID=UPI001CD79876|nr:hypothetical protein [Bacillus infantis]MCA1040471.1 hypothetical protein [Bacillus infantis]